LGTVALDRDRGFWAALWPAAVAATGMARAAARAKIVMALFIEHLPSSRYMKRIGPGPGRR
jgi:hypothetical protein